MYFRLQEPDHEDQQYPANLYTIPRILSPNQIPHQKYCQHLQHTSDKMCQEHHGTVTPIIRPLRNLNP